ncbi:glutamate-1-semialdehyde-2,1-aminomutase [Lacihabitans sp. LS3-19]|uniref:glutamate-1-semialdehyde 2,1-aminomutase n=1 Tax=Lacihabitans sp. LS3-19 TaxID=2487335 RepID=UPI0020CC204E|nr:glutamate-1-semialdehyde 2,1-aminomutase [Lacihabitans sp. LS3-19]MCP9766967.1 glutamate-1-semialdehyde-2,1-aminomutase [Lacihabitans sp. LS3-19]
MKNKNSSKLFEEAKKYIPGGVNSPVRAFKSVGGNPRFIKRAKGAYLIDEDNNKYVDMINSWGPMILGHAFGPIENEVKKATKSSFSFGAPTEKEVRMAKLICDLVPSVEMVRMVNSGTEATMSAIRLARAYTVKDKIIKFEGCYHGHGDAFLISAGSGALSMGHPDSPGVTQSTANDTLTAPYNNKEALSELITKNKGKIAGLILEPVVGNMGCVLPETGYLEFIREICTKEKIVLIFDEVMTGFRLALGGAQERFGVTPDLTTMGKIIGGGMPVGAYGGKKELMEMVSPSGPMYQAGTLSGNPIAMSAGLEMLKQLKNHPEIYKNLDEAGQEIAYGIKAALNELELNYTVNQIGSMYSLFFTDQTVTDYDKAKTCDTQTFGKYFNFMLEKGIYLAPSQFESLFISTRIDKKLIKKILKANFQSLYELKAQK